MKMSINPYYRSWIGEFTVGFLISLLLITPVVFAHDFHNDGDDGSDNPDGVNRWYAPNSTTHFGEWRDNNACGYEDYVYDAMLLWTANIQQQWASVPTKNYVHEWQTDYVAYEADSYYWTSLPTPDHNEDSIWGEEILDGYEERELGWDTPSVQIPGNYMKYIWTKYYPMFAPCPPDPYTTYIYMESELTVPSAIGNWWPESWDVLGTINTHGVN
ncbi:MAG: hypothetical protein DYG89_23810 [Caldilinea sp. CFX5]|nr:hypothetical protein [Caldilinea sp. CFX5]